MHISNNQKKSSISQLNLEKITPRQLTKLYQGNHTEYETDEIYNENFENVDSANSIDYSNISKDQFIAQGFSSNDKYVFIGAYSKKEKSRIYMYDKLTGEYLFYIKTNNKSHMGGTSFDKTNNILYITNGSKDIIAINWEMINNYIKFNRAAIERYGFFSYDNINSWCNNSTNYKDSFLIDTTNIKMSDGLSSSYSYCDNNYLYIGHFNTASDSIKECKVRQYELNYDRDNNKLTIKNIMEYPTPIHTQGMATYSKDGNNYIIFSNSLFGSSTLDVYEIEDNGKLKQINTIDLTKYGAKAGGVEGIEIREDGTLHGIFEFEPYKSFTISNDRLFEYNPLVDRPSLKNRAFKLIAGAWYSSNDLIDTNSELTSSNLIIKQKALELKNKIDSTILNINDSLNRASSNKDHNIIDRAFTNTGGFISNLAAFPTTYSIFKQTIAKDGANGKSAFSVLSDFSDCIGEPTGNVIIDGIGTGAKWAWDKTENLGEWIFDIFH